MFGRPVRDASAALGYPLVDKHTFHKKFPTSCGTTRRRKMSTPRFKKDKEIIAEYESQVKGKREGNVSPGIVLVGAAEH